MLCHKIPNVMLIVPLGAKILPNDVNCFFATKFNEAFGSILKRGILNWNFKFLLPLGRPKLHPNFVIPLTINITISLENMHVQVSLQTDSSINTFADSVSMATESGMNIFFCKIFIMNDPVTLWYFNWHWNFKAIIYIIWLFYTVSSTGILLKSTKETGSDESSGSEMGLVPVTVFDRDKNMNGRMDSEKRRSAFSSGVYPTLYLVYISHS